MTEQDDVLDAAFERSGLLRVDSIEDLFSKAQVLAEQPRPAGNRLAIVTNAGGPGVMATDAHIEDGGEAATIGQPALDALNAVLPPCWSHGDPINILGDATAERFAKTIEIVAADPNKDGLRVIYAPQGAGTATEVAERVANVGKLQGKPILASWMGGDEVQVGAAILERAGIPTFAYPDYAARIFNLMRRYDDNLRALLETPIRTPDDAAPNRAVARALFAGMLSEGRTQLTEAEAKRLLAAYEIATVPGAVAMSAEAAVSAAESLGYPVALKVHSATIRHKTDVGGVRLRIGDAHGVRRAFDRIASAVATKGGPHAFEGVTVQPMIDVDHGYELIVGSSYRSALRTGVALRARWRARRGFP